MALPLLATRLSSDIELDVQYVAKKGLKAFVEVAWEQFEPSTPFIKGWHIDEICYHLECLYAGEIENLILNMPPGCMKSLLCSVMFPLWIWTFKPEYRFLNYSFDQTLSTRDGRRVRNCVESKWWQDRWPDVKILADNSSVSEFENNRTGFRLSSTPRGKGTGRHGNLVTVDDPHKPLEMAGGGDLSAESNTVWEWWTGTIPTRAADPKNFHKLIVMQRLAENDLSGRVIDEMTERLGEHYEVLRLPMEFEARSKCLTKVGGDKRNKDGSLLWPQRFSKPVVERLKTSLRGIGGERNVAGQLQQKPTADEGNFFKKETLQHWGLGSKFPIMPTMMDMTVEISGDCTFKGATESVSGKPDYVVFQVWGFVFRSRDALLLDQIRGQWGFSETVNNLRALKKKWPRAWTIKIEAKANGPAVANVLSAEIPGIELVEPEGGKVARANAVQPVFRAGCVWLPPEQTQNMHGDLWVPGYKRELLGFPGAKHDDQVDTTTQALLQFASGASQELMQQFAEAVLGKAVKTNAA